MHRTTIYLDSDLELRLRAEAARIGISMAEIIRDAIREKLSDAPAARSPHAGAFSSGRSDVSERAEEILGEAGFGSES